MEIEEGRLVESPCPHCGHMERRAFGESVSDRGELASYAIGWTSGHEEVVGYMTVGLGAGNPGGGTFHIDVRVVDDEPGMALVDRPFERVPEGGPDLTREAALAHEDLDYVWFVADNVMLKDRRAWWMEHYLRGTRAFATRPVVDAGADVRHVVREADGEWQLLCGTVEADEPLVFHLHHALDRDRTLLDVLDLEPGERADREARDRPWERSRA
jgi:hypothetical protein